MATGFWKRLDKGALRIAVAFALLAVAAGTAAADPVGDYGDAPDDALHYFPTIYGTTHSRLGKPGANHTTTGLEMLGPTVSNEAGATDPADPDGVPNLVDTDAGDDGLNGVWFYPVSPPGVPYPGLPGYAHQMMAQFTIYVDASAPDTTRSLNVLVDTNRDQQWRNTRSGREWVLVNMDITAAPGTSETITVPLDIVTTGPGTPLGDCWMRVTLTRTPIDEAATSTTGGWDGSGQFDYGETEDYLLYTAAAPDTPNIPPPPPPPPLPPPCPSCSWRVRCKPSVLKMMHDQSKNVTLEIKVRGPCSVVLSGMREDPIGPMIGIGIVNGANPGDIGAPSTPVGGLIGVGPGTFTVTVPITPVTHPIGAIQSFGIKFRLSGYDCNGTKVFAASKTCGVLIFHPDKPCRKGVLKLGPANPKTPLQPVPFDPDPPYSPPHGTIIPGNMQFTSATIELLEMDDSPPGQPAGAQQTLNRMSFFDVFYDIDPALPDEAPEIQTEIVGLELRGWTDPEWVAAGIPAEEAIQVSKIPVYIEPFFDVFYERTTDVGQVMPVDTANNSIRVLNLKGMSMWVLGGPGSPFVPVTVTHFLVE